MNKQPITNPVFNENTCTKAKYLETLSALELVEQASTHPKTVRLKKVNSDGLVVVPSSRRSFKNENKSYVEQSVFTTSSTKGLIQDEGWSQKLITKRLASKN